jgi:hypothetical protein
LRSTLSTIYHDCRSVDGEFQPPRRSTRVLGPLRPHEFCSLPYIPFRKRYGLDLEDSLGDHYRSCKHHIWTYHDPITARPMISSLAWGTYSCRSPCEWPVLSLHGNARFMTAYINAYEEVFAFSPLVRKGTVIQILSALAREVAESFPSPLTHAHRTTQAWTNVSKSVFNMWQHITLPSPLSMFSVASSNLHVRQGDGLGATVHQGASTIPIASSIAPRGRLNRSLRTSSNRVWGRSTRQALIGERSLESRLLAMWS